MIRAKIDLCNPIFNDDTAAREYLETVLWPHGPVCPRCSVMGDRITKLTDKSTRPGVYNCKDCHEPFSVTVGTIMERSHIPLSKWVLATCLMAASKKGMSAHQLHPMLNIDETGPLGGANRVVEAHETYIGGKEATSMPGSGKALAAAPAARCRSYRVG